MPAGLPQGLTRAQHQTLLSERLQDTGFAKFTKAQMNVALNLAAQYIQRVWLTKAGFDENQYLVTGGSTPGQDYIAQAPVMLYESLVALDDDSGSGQFGTAYPVQTIQEFFKYQMGTLSLPPGYQFAYTKYLDLTANLWYYLFTPTLGASARNYRIWGVPLAYIDPNTTYDSRVFQLPASCDAALNLKAQIHLLRNTPDADVTPLLQDLALEINTLDILVKSNAGAQQISLPARDE